MTTRYRIVLVGAVALLGATVTTTGRVPAAKAGLSTASTAADWLDPSFGGGLSRNDLSPGKDVPAGMAVQADGRVVIAATTQWGTYQSDIVVLRFLPDGRPDSAFGTDGRVTLDYNPIEVAIGVAIQPDGMIVVAGGGNTPMILARMDGTGRLDPGFSGGVVRVDAVKPGFHGAPLAAMALAPDGRIVVSGSLRKGDMSGPMVIRFNSDGTLDDGFGDHGFASRQPTTSSSYEGAESVVVLPSGAVVVGGTQTQGSFLGTRPSSLFTLTRFSPTGALDASFGQGGVIYSDLSQGTDLRDAYLSHIALQPDGRIVAAGSVVHFAAPPAARSRDVAVVRYLADGRLDPGFGAAGIVVSPAPPTTNASGFGWYSGSGMANAVVVDGSGRVLVGGGAMGSAGTFDMAVVRYTPTGILDRTFGRAGWIKLNGPGEESVSALAMQSDGRPLFAGTGEAQNVMVSGRLDAFAGTTTVTAWGWNGLGQLGDDSNSQRNAPVPVPGQGPRATPLAGSLHSLSLRADGTVTAWGWNALGTLGDGSTTDRDTPATVPGLASVSAIAAGTYHNLAVSGGRVYAWGWNGLGQLGDGTVVDRRTPVVVPGLTDVVEVSAGMYHSLARLSDGTVWAWGWNALGQLGDGTTIDRHRPVRVPGVFRAVSVSAGALHSLVVAAHGEALGGTSGWAWGHNGVGQVDSSGDLMRTTPSLILARHPVAISAGSYHNVVLLDDGTVLTWGWNGVGQIGNGTTEQPRWPLPVTGVTDATSISAGLAHTLATDRSGRVWGWGWNAIGQLGDGTTTDRLSPAPAAMGLTLASAGWYHSLAGRTR